jgi:hypothetical protein
MDDDDEEGYDWGPKYSIVLQEEAYEDDEPRGYDKSPESNYDPDVETWDPWEPSYFFRIT